MLQGRDCSTVDMHAQGAESRHRADHHKSHVSANNSAGRTSARTYLATYMTLCMYMPSIGWAVACRLPDYTCAALL